MERNPYEPVLMYITVHAPLLADQVECVSIELSLLPDLVRSKLLTGSRPFFMPLLLFQRNAIYVIAGLFTNSVCVEYADSWQALKEAIDEAEGK